MTFASEVADTEPRRTPAASHRAPRSGVRLGSVPADSEEDLRFLQDRVALFAKTTFWISTMFLVVTTLADAFADTQRYWPLGRAFHTLGTLVALGVWLTTRSRRSLSPRALQWIDIVGTAGICWSFAALGHFALQPSGSYTGLLALTHVSISRAMIVPSVPSRTLLLAAACFAALVVSRAMLPMSQQLLQVMATRGRSVLEAALWSTAGTTVSTVASAVIYGLHEKAREARQLGQYLLEEKIGEGGMGEVYRAHHAMLRRPTAVKLLAGDGSEAQLKRFEKEVQLTAKLTHPNTISIYDYGRTPDGVFYYAMELLDGLTLEQLVQQHGPQPAGRVIHVLRQICGALAEAHRIGLIHRDIKPANIHLCRRGDMPDFVKVLDFGLVREIKNDGSITQSNVNVVVGTPLFISPEAILTPDRIDARADIYGLGCVAYFLLTATPPFSGQTVVELCAHHLHTPPQPPSERHPVPDDLERVILSCMAKDPASRPESARALGRELERCRDALTWAEAEAEVWWTQSASRRALPRSKRRQNDEPARRTICCADLEERLSERQNTA